MSHLPGKDFLRGFGSRLGCWALGMTSLSHQGYKGSGQYDFMSSQFCGTRAWESNRQVSFHNKLCNENPVFFHSLKCLRYYICSLTLCKVLRNLWQLWGVRCSTHIHLLTLALFLWNLIRWTSLKLFNFSPLPLMEICSMVQCSSGSEGLSCSLLEKSVERLPDFKVHKAETSKQARAQNVEEEAHFCICLLPWAHQGKEWSIPAHSRGCWTCPWCHCASGMPFSEIAPCGSCCTAIPSQMCVVPSVARSVCPVLSFLNLIAVLASTGRWEGKWTARQQQSVLVNFSVCPVFLWWWKYCDELKFLVWLCLVCCFCSIFFLLFV